MSELNEDNKRGKGRPKEWTDEKIEKIAKDMWKWFNENPEGINSYMLKSYYVKKGIPAQYISEFSKRNEYFSETIKRIQDLLEVRINEGALTGKIKEASAIFNLKCNYGWVDRQEINHTGENINININAKGKSKLDN